MSEKNPEKLIIGLFEGRISVEGLTELKKELQNNCNSRKLYDEYLDIWQSTAKARKTNDYDPDTVWQQFKFSIKKPARKNVYPLFISMKNLYYYAAAAILLFLAGSLSYYLLSNRVKNDNYLTTNEYIVPYGSRSQLILPDGSKIWLNSGSKLSYNNRFGHSNRDINLEGEAYFDVAKNANLPFVINASDLNIKVLGTAFNVKAYPDEDYVETTVERGMVQVSEEKETLEKRQNIILSANQKMVYLVDKKSPAENKLNSQTMTKNTEPAKNTGLKPAIDIDKVYTKIYTSWKDNRWIIEGEELQSLVIKLERRYNVLIIINDEALKKYRFSGILENETLEQVMEAIKLTAPINYKIEQKQVVLSRNKYFKPNQ
ncbi:MAG: FecR family protein [Bacteroidales bacterium]|nr:FecR family protein [Bacteroidales bacterium]